MYRWKPGSVHVVDAELAGRALEEIAGRHGVLTPRLLVEESKPVDAPLHPEFEWDDAVAAERYREEQARYIIRSVIVSVPEREDAFVRAFVSVVPPEAGDAEAEGGAVAGAVEEAGRQRPVSVYVRTVDALADPRLRRQVVERALAELDVWRRRYAELAELARLFEAVQEARQMVLEEIQAAA